MNIEARPPLRKEDGRLLRGAARFVDDVHLDRMAHGAFVRWPCRMRTLSQSTPSRALAAGALTVLTANDLPFNDQPWIVRYWHPSIRNGLPKFLAAEPRAFCRRTCSPSSWRKIAIRRKTWPNSIDVDYRPLPIIATIAGCDRRETRRCCIAEWIGNVAAAFEHRHGNAARALSDCAHRARRRFHFRSPSPRSAGNPRRRCRF